MLLNESTIVISYREHTIVHDRHNLTGVALLCMITEGKSAFPLFPLFPFHFPLL